MKLRDPIQLVLKEKGDQVFCIDTEASVYDALAIMSEKQIGAVLVLKEKRLVGLFTERDYARKVVLLGRASRQLRVREIMSSPVVSVQMDTTVDDCMQHMTNRRCRHLPVVDGEEIVGVVSLGDLVNWIMTKQDQTIHDLEDYIKGPYPG